MRICKIWHLGEGFYYRLYLMALLLNLNLLEITEAGGLINVLHG